MDLPLEVERGATTPDAIRCAPITAGMPSGQRLCAITLMRDLSPEGSVPLTSCSGCLDLLPGCCASFLDDDGCEPFTEWSSATCLAKTATRPGVKLEDGDACAGFCVKISGLFLNQIPMILLYALLATRDTTVIRIVRKWSLA